MSIYSKNARSYKKDEKRTLKLSSGLDENIKYIQIDDSEPINTPLAVSSDTVMVKGSLDIKGSATMESATMGAIQGTTITASTKFDHVMSIQTHAFYMTGTSGVYLPFGPSAIEGSSTSDSANDDTLFIVPYSGSFEFLQVQCATGAGSVAGATRVQLRVNGTDGAYVQVTLDNEVTGTFTFSTDNTFSAGDRLRIKFDPLAAPKYVSATSVWKYTL